MSDEQAKRKRDRLYGHLEQGYARLQQRIMQGQDASEWEEFWVNLLNEYERVCDELQGINRKDQ